jgi:hypothetical protein
MSNSPPPPYSSATPSPTMVQEEIDEPLQQEGARVRVYRGRIATEHIVPVLRYAYSAPSPPAEQQGVSSSSATSVRAEGVTPSSSGASGSRRGSLVDRIASTARNVLHLPGHPPPIPPRSPHRPRTANAVMQSSSSSSIPISYLPRPTTEGIVPSPIPEVSIENTPIIGAPVDNTPPEPPAPVIQPVSLPAGLSPISNIDLRQFETVSRRGSTPLIENRLPTPLAPRTNGASSPLGNMSDASSDFVYTADTFPLERIVSSDPVRHSRGSHSMMLMQLASNLRVEADEDPDVTAANMRSPDLSMWHNGASSPSLSTTPLIVRDTSSSFYNSPGSPRSPTAPVPTVPMQRTSPFFGGGSISRRRGSSATSPERATIRSAPERMEQLADSHEERVGVQSSSEPSLLGTTGVVIQRSPERPVEDPSSVPIEDPSTYVPVTRASMVSTTHSQHQHGTIGSFSSAGIGSPSTWSNPLRSSRSIMSAQRGSEEHEQIFTPGSIYTPLAPELGDEPTQSTSYGPRSPQVATRDLGSQDSGQGTQGQHDAYLDQTPRPKEELVTSTTMASASTMSQHSSYHSFPSDAPLLSIVESSSADSTRREQAQTDQTPRPAQLSARERVRLAAERHLLGLPSAYEERKRMSVAMPTSYLNYNPEDEEYASTNASPTPRFTEIPIAPEPEAKSETPPGPRTIHQALEPEPARTTVAKVPERPARPSSVGLGIVLPPDVSTDNAEAGPSGTSAPYDPIKTPMDRLLAGKKKEKKSDAGDYLRRQKDALFSFKDQMVANVSSGTRSLGRGFHGKRRESIIISAPTPILEAQSEADTPRQSQNEVPRLSTIPQRRPKTAGSTSESVS